MKIKTTVTEIECSANELRQSNSLADGIINILRNCFNGRSVPTVTEEEIAEEMAKEQENGNDV